MKKLLTLVGGFFSGIANGLLGAGGGMIAVPALRRAGLSTVQSHATSVAVILPLCALSAGIYLARGDVTLHDALPYLPWMIAGSLLGAKILPRLSSTVLRRMFGVLMLWAAWRMFAA